MLVAGLVINTSSHVQEKQHLTLLRRIIQLRRILHATMKDLTPGPLYEELLRSTPEHQDQLVELKENVAYGPNVK
jgi:hypothetical protein